MWIFQGGHQRDWSGAEFGLSSVTARSLMTEMDGLMQSRTAGS